MIATHSLFTVTQIQLMTAQIIYLKNAIHPHNQSTVIIQQFNMVMHELKILWMKCLEISPKLHKGYHIPRKPWKSNRECDIRDSN